MSLTVCSLCFFLGTTSTWWSIRVHYFLCPVYFLPGTTNKTFHYQSILQEGKSKPVSKPSSLTLTSTQLVFSASSQGLACLPACQAACVSCMAVPLAFLPCLPASVQACLSLPSYYVVSCLCLPACLPSPASPCCLYMPLPAYRCLHGSMPISLHVPCFLSLRNFTQVPLPGCLLLSLSAWLPACFPACLDAFSGLF
jgi:hypothetical protein